MGAKAKKAQRAATTQAAKPQLVEAKSRQEVQLDLGCGSHPREGFEGVDLYAKEAKHRVDLFKYPFPFESDSIDAIHCSHFLEHIPAREVEARDLSDPKRTDLIGQDMLFCFMDECWRILKLDSWMHVLVPSGRSNRAFWDPTHRRFFMQETFFYFAKQWREANGLGHYRASCNFAFETSYSMDQSEGVRSAEAQAHRFAHYWNVTIDYMAKLKKLSKDAMLTPPAPPPPAAVAAGPKL
jgi:predicted SAM-dependent methyltransferase